VHRGGAVGRAYRRQFRPRRPVCPSMSQAAEGTSYPVSDAAPRLLGSVVIPAHNESAAIRRCLDALFAGVAPGELDVVVVCNGCADDTAARARSSSHPVRVLELEPASKPAALRAGDEAARALPRIYLDADVVLCGSAARALLERLGAGAVAARPPIRYISSASSAPVRSYYRARSQVPALLGSLWGAGVYGLSEAGRGRFDAFPDVVADDLWMDRQFAPHEIEIVECDPVEVMVPRRVRDLFRVLRRTYRGKAETAGVDPHDRARETTLSTMRQLRRLAAAGPYAAVDAATYAAFVVAARLALAAPLTRSRWERDESSRTP
jgi:glycosyltransferase involved in cell wall biosynthesis